MPPVKIEMLGGVSVRLAKVGGGAVTDTVAEPVAPSTVARMDVVPTTRPDTTPLLATDATVGAVDDHDTGRPVSTLPAASRATTVSAVVAPATTEGAAGVMVTLATGATAVVPLAMLESGPYTSPCPIEPRNAIACTR